MKRIKVIGLALLALSLGVSSLEAKAVESINTLERAVSTIAPKERIAKKRARLVKRKRQTEYKKHHYLALHKKARAKALLAKRGIKNAKKRSTYRGTRR